MHVIHVACITLFILWLCHESNNIVYSTAHICNVYHQLLGKMCSSKQCRYNQKQTLALAWHGLYWSGASIGLELGRLELRKRKIISFSAQSNSAKGKGRPAGFYGSSGCFIVSEWGDSVFSPFLPGLCSWHTCVTATLLMWSRFHAVYSIPLVCN